MSESYDVKILQRGQVLFVTKIVTDSAPEAVLTAMNTAAEMGWVGDEPGETTTIEVVRHYHGLGEKE